MWQQKTSFENTFYTVHSKGFEAFKTKVIILMQTRSKKADNKKISFMRLLYKKIG